MPADGRTPPLCGLPPRGATVIILRARQAPRYVRGDGIRSWLLASPRTCGTRHLTITRVDIEPGGRQRLHHHEAEQVYFILDGGGEMTVGQETAPVGPGDCVFIPGGAPHGLVNSGEEPLRYVSAAAPAFSAADLAAMWPLPAQAPEP